MAADPRPSRLSIIVPVLNEATVLERLLTDLQALRDRGHEVLVVDGGSGDGSVNLAVGLADRVLASPPGRAAQMNAGAAVASGDYLLFLHADTRMPPGADELVARALAPRGRVWGRFDVRLSGGRWPYRMIEWAMNLRSRLSGIATGDQCIFVRRQAFQAVGGFPRQPLMEDLALSRRLKRLGRPACLHARVVTSSRRWEERGIVRTVLLMWTLRAAYTLGVSPARLARVYYPQGGPGTAAG